MNPFYFGTGERRLFGIYEPASPGSPGRRAAVLCQPWGSEYLHAHRTMRQLAIRLSAAGFHSLRFDYYGAGDSAGESEEADLAGWEDDIATAVDELRDMTGVPQVTLIGLRLGATLAARFAARHSDAVEAVVLWDPILSGSRYVRELAAADIAGSNTAADQAGMTELAGFCVGTAMLHDLQSINLDESLASLTPRVLVAVTQPPGEPDRNQTALFQGGGTSLAVECIDSIKPWLEDNATGGVVPVEVIRRIVDWLE